MKKHIDEIHRQISEDEFFIEKKLSIIDS